MRDFIRRVQFSFWLVVSACQAETDPPAGAPDQGGPNDTPSPPLPSPDPVPTTGPGDESSSSTSTSSTGDLGPGTTRSTDSLDSSTGLPSVSCGDGIVDPGEQCDDSYQHNSNGAGCTETCLLAACGDGLVWAGMEQCDLGADNNDENYSGCQESCLWGPRCGDGLLQQGDEECDASAPPIDGLAACEPDTCKFAARLAFVTTAQFTGALGGLALADTTCIAAAAAVGLDSASSFRAWLSDGVATPQSRLKQAAADPGYPYARRDGQLLALDLADLIAHGPKLPLDVTETGEILPAKHFAWTNIGADGAPFSAVNHCKEWTSKNLGVTARVGKISPASLAEIPDWKAARRWTSDTLTSCNSKAHLYCFED